MLFRKQVLDAQQVRLYGNVLIVSPIRFWVVSGFLSAIVIILIMFLASASFARIERVSGAVVPSLGIVRMAAPAAGIIKGFSLSEGQQVQEGEVLGRISTPALAFGGMGTRNGARLASIAGKLEQLGLQRAQSEIVHTLDMTSKDREVAEISARLKIARETVAFQLQILAEAESAWDRVRQLSERNLINAETVSSQRIELISSRRELLRLQSEIGTLTMEMETVGFSRRQMTAQADLRNLQYDAEEQNLISERQIMRGLEAFDIVAPANGIATAVLVANEHQVQPNTELFSILPDNSALEVELYVPSRAIGFVAPGQAVSLLFDAFPYQRFGSHRGTIAEVTGSVILPGSPGLLVRVEEPVYRVTVELERETVAAFGRDMQIQPGMQITANIILEDRTVFDWLFEPLISVARRT